MVVKGVHLQTTMNIQGGPRTGMLRQLVAVGVGAAVASVGAFIGVMGALGAYMGCHGHCGHGVWLIVAFGGVAIMATSPFVIACVSNREWWLTWGALGLATGTAAFFLAREVTAMAGVDDAGWTVILPSFGLAAAVALPARDRWFVAARVVGMLALSMVPALIHDAGVLVRWVVHSYPHGSSMSGWEGSRPVLDPALAPRPTCWAFPSRRDRPSGEPVPRPDPTPHPEARPQPDLR